MQREQLPQTMLIREDSSSGIFYQRWGGIYAVWFVGLIFLSTCGYWVGNKFSSGIELTYTPNSGPKLPDCLYFSIVTISSLGYGDIRPVGFGRIIAALEVLCGLVILGMWISHLTSRKTELYLERIHNQAIDERFKEFRVNIRRLTKEFEKSVHEYLNQGNEVPRLFSAGSSSIGSVLDELFAIVDGATRYLRYEVKNRLFFDTAGSVPFGRLLDALTKASDQLGASAIILIKSSCEGQKLEGNFFRLKQIIQRTEVIALCAKNLSRDKGHQAAGALLLDKVNIFYKSVPERSNLDAQPK